MHRRGFLGAVAALAGLLGAGEGHSRRDETRAKVKGRRLLFGRYRLEAVGADWDGQVKPIRELRDGRGRFMGRLYKIDLTGRMESA